MNKTNRIEITRLDGEVCWIAPDQIGPIITGRRKVKGGEEETVLTLILLPGNVTFQTRDETLETLLTKMGAAFGLPVNIIR